MVIKLVCTSKKVSKKDVSYHSVKLGESLFTWWSLEAVSIDWIQSVDIETNFRPYKILRKFQSTGNWEE